MAESSLPTPDILKIHTPEIPKPRVAITMTQHILDGNNPEISLDKNGGYAKWCERMKQKNVTQVRFDVRIIDVLREDGTVNTEYLQRMKQIAEIGNNAGLDNVPVLSTAPDWALKLARDNPQEFFKVYTNYVDAVFEAFSADGGKPPEAIQVFNELNVGTYTQRELLPHLDTCIAILREKSEKYFHKQVPLVATLQVSTPVTLKTVPYFMPESALDFIDNHTPLLKQFDRLNLDCYPGIWHIPMETLKLYLKNVKYFIDAYRARNDTDKIAALPKPVDMFTKAFGTTELLENVIQHLEPFQKQGIRIGIGETGLPTFTPFETDAMKEQNEKLQAFGFAVLIKNFRHLINKHGLWEFGAYGAYKEKPELFGILNWGIDDVKGEPTYTEGPLMRLMDRINNPLTPLHKNPETGKWSE